MEYVIYTVGNAQFLGAIFNGVAAITTSNSFTTLISIGMLFGVLYCCWECIMNGTRAFNLQHMLVAICMYLCMFGPTRTVIIQDVYNNNTGDVVVDNIPLGVAASGSIVSRIGYNICVLIETAYHPAEAVATVYQGGFAEPLRILNQFRTFDFGPEVMKAINEKLGKFTPYNGSKAVLSDYRQAVSNYIRDCTYPEIQMGHKSIDEIKTAKADASPLKSNSTALHTYLPIARTSGNSDSQTFSCSAGYDTLVSVFNEVFSDASVTNAMAKGIGGSLLKTAGTFDNLDQSLSALGLTGINAQQITKNRIVNSVLDAAASGHYKTMQDSATAIATMSAIDQRNIQWASEGTMFTKSMHALMTFIEGFVYAIMPIMAFVFVMGAMGMRIVGKYFQIILWIQLWYPIMAIVNLYVMSSTKNALQPYATSSSFYFLDKVFSEVETHIGVAGLMLGATPMLALLIITGSSMAFTAIAGRMGGQDHFNEKNIQPDAINVGALNAVAPYANTNVGQGARLTGTESFTPVLDISAAQSAATSMSKAQAMEASNTASRNLLSAQSDAASQMLQASTFRNTAAQLQSTDAQTYQAVASLTRKMGWGSGKDGSVTQEDVGRTATWLSGGLTVPFTSIGAGTKGELTNSLGVKMSYNAKEDISKDEAAAFSKMDSASLQKSVSAGFGKTVTTTDSKTLSAINSTTLGKNISESVKASETYAKTQSASNSIGADRKIQADTFANAIKPYLENGGNNFVRSAYQDAINDQSIPPERRQALARSAEIHTKFHGGDAVMGMAIAYTDFAMKKENNRMGDAQTMLHAAGISSFVGQNDYKFTPKSLEKVGSVEGVGYHGPEDVRGDVEKKIAGTSAEVKGVTGETEKLHGTTGGNPNTHFDNTKEEVKGIDAGNQSEIKEKTFQSIEDQIQNSIFRNASAAKGGFVGSKEFDQIAEKNLAGLNEEQIRYLKATRLLAVADALDLGQENAPQSVRDAHKPELAEIALYNSVEQQYMNRYGNKFDEKIHRAEINKSFAGMKATLDSADIRKPASLTEISQFNRSVADK